LLRIQAERTGSRGEMAEWTKLEADIFSEQFSGVNLSRS
jgi:hypothetical protein